MESPVGDYGDSEYLLRELTELDPSAVPRVLRHSLDDDFTTAWTIVGAFNDWAVDPRVGGLIGWPSIRALYRRWLGDLTDRQIRTIVRTGAYLDDGPFARFIGRFPAINITSGDNHCGIYLEAMSDMKRENVMKRWTVL
jgi:hypothetical protein